MPASLRLLHQINLRNDAWGGMEKSFCRFLGITRDDPELRSFLADNLRDLAGGVEAALANLDAPPLEARFWHGLPVPKRPALLRRWHKRAQARRWQVNRVLNWNQFGDGEPARLARALRVPSVYWERGAAWFRRQAPLDRDFTEGYDLYLANTRACRQMLRECGGVKGEIRLCRPPVYVNPGVRAPRLLQGGRPLRLGFVSRLRAFKGGVLALHALAAVRRQGLDAELWIAGDGSDEMRMRGETARLGLDAQVRFLGRVQDVEGLLERIDLLLHPALREPYGNSCAEALTAGLPVVATCVDGLPEVIDDGIDGYCVTPSLRLADYAQFGGDAADVYPLVYRPERGLIAEPGVPDPEALAAAVIRVLGDPQRYTAFSAAALATYETRFSVRMHLQRLKALLGDCHVKKQPWPLVQGSLPVLP